MAGLTLALRSSSLISLISARYPRRESSEILTSWIDLAVIIAAMIVRYLI